MLSGIRHGKNPLLWPVSLNLLSKCSLIDSQMAYPYGFKIINPFAEMCSANPAFSTTWENHSLKLSSFLIVIPISFLFDDTDVVVVIFLFN